MAPGAIFPPLGASVSQHFGVKWTNNLDHFSGGSLRGALAPALTRRRCRLPRGNGKSWLAAHVLTRCLTPGDPLHVPGAEYLLCAASIEQSRLCFQVRAGGPGADRALSLHRQCNENWDNGAGQYQAAGAVQQRQDGNGDREHADPGGRRTRIVGSRTAGQLMHDAIMTAQGKPGSALAVPSTSAPWRRPCPAGGTDLIEDGTHGSTFVQALQGGDAKTSGIVAEIRRVQPAGGRLR